MLPLVDHSLFDQLAGTPSRALLLDYDGTLSAFHTERSAARMAPAMQRAVQRIIAHDERTHVAIITGRDLDPLVPLLGLDPLPEMWGCHGWEQRRSDGTEVRLPLPAAAEAALHTGRERIAALGLSEHLEEKYGCMTFHWRGIDAETAARYERSVTAAWRPLASGTGLLLHPCHAGIELRAGGRTKRDAIAAILAALPPETCAVYIGDDVTDEDAFRAVRERGVGILVAAEERPSAATRRLESIGAVRQFLEEWDRRVAGRP